MTHTPTPWTPDTRRIIGADGHVVCYSSAFGSMDLISDADARLIVLAVNNHSRLVGVLEAMINAAEDDMPWLHSEYIDAARHLLNDLTASQPPRTT